MKVIFYILLAGIGVSRCQSAEKLTHKAIAKDRAKVQQITRTLWPCITTDSNTVTKTDTLYDLIEVQCPDSIAYRVDSFETSTAVRVPYRVPVYVKVQTPRIRETITHTITKRDAAEVDICMAKNEHLEKGVKYYRRMARFFGGLTAFFALLCFLLYKSRR